MREERKPVKTVTAVLRYDREHHIIVIDYDPPFYIPELGETITETQLEFMKAWERFDKGTVKKVVEQGSEIVEILVRDLNLY